MENKVLKVGITGGIGSGKTLVSKIFTLFGIPLYNADERAKWLMSNDALLRARIIEAFGPEAYDQHQRPNVAFLAGKVFNNPPQLAILNSLVHPLVGKDFDDWAAMHREV